MTQALTVFINIELTIQGQGIGQFLSNYTRYLPEVYSYFMCHGLGDLNMETIKIHFTAHCSSFLIYVFHISNISVAMITCPTHGGLGIAFLISLWYFLINILKDPGQVLLLSN